MILKVVVLSLMAVFYISYFSKMLSQRKKGISTDQLGKGKDGIRKFIEIVLKITTYIILVIQVFSILYYSANVHLIIRIAGVLIELSGIVVFIVSVIEMKDNWRAGIQKKDKTNLVTTGIYSVSRNPAFLGFNLMYIGILLTFFNWCLLIITIFAVVIFHLQIIRVEEEFLTDTFGQEYIDYKKTVFRYFGRKIYRK